MKTFLIAILTLFVAGAMVMPDTADARRLGGGKSLGKQYNMPRQAQQPQRQQQATDQRGAQSGAAGQAGRKGGMGWLGPLAGLAAGGLLASLFFGGAFEGFQPLDFLLIAALVIGGFLLFRMLRQQRAPARSPAPAGAVPGAYRTGDTPFGAGPTADQDAAARPDGARAVAPEPVAADAPAWFDAEGFAEGAKTHFIRLQAAWDQADFRDIREYTAPQLFAELKRERESLGDARNYTEVVTLSAELLGVQRDGEQAVASVRFTGLIREDEQAPAKPLDEIWHVAHDWASPEGDWLITGIQQPE
jgi:predicted lipid-binding transport protein (Tim44 family)